MGILLGVKSQCPRVGPNFTCSSHLVHTYIPMHVRIVPDLEGVYHWGVWYTTLPVHTYVYDKYTRVGSFDVNWKHLHTGTHACIVCYVHCTVLLCFDPDLIKHTDTSHCDYPNLQEALESLRNVMTWVSYCTQSQNNVGVHIFLAAQTD